MKLLPATLAWRTTLVLLAGLLVSNMIGLLIFTGERTVALNSVAKDDIAQRIAAVSRTINGVPAADRPDVACRQSSNGFAALASPTPLVGASDDSRAGHEMLAALRPLLGNPPKGGLRIATLNSNQEAATFEAFAPILANCTGLADTMNGRLGGMRAMPVMSAGMIRIMQGWRNSDLLRVSYRLDGGGWVNFLTTPARVTRLFNPRFLLAFLVMSLIVTALSVWAVRRSTGPLELFARASERLGHDMNAPSLPEDGPREVSRAAHAFNQMQTRLRRLISDRTQMLAAVSHDLRTPVTRLRLRAEFVEDDDQREKMLGDLAQMEAMIAATLSFARLDNSNEAKKALDIAGLLQSVCDDMAELGRDVTYEGPDRLAMNGRPTALRRVFDNLVDNAVKYGDRAEVSLRKSGRKLTITICDHGPGIPKSDLEAVFQPFQRVETSRNRETGGVGLGLAVVRSIVRGHGGEVTLKNAPHGGLCATVTLPTGDV